MCRNILLTRQGEWLIVDGVFIVAGQRPRAPVAGVETFSLITVIDSQKIPFAQQLSRVAHPAQGVQIDLRTPAIAKLSPGNVVAIQIRGNFIRRGPVKRLSELSIADTHKEFAQFAIAYFNDMDGEGIDQLIAYNDRRGRGWLLIRPLHNLSCLRCLSILAGAYIFHAIF